MAMSDRPPRLRAVTIGDAPLDTASGGDLALLAFLVLVNLVPIAGSLAGGRWSQGTVGLATVGVLLAGRELARELRARVRARR